MDYLNSRLKALRIKQGLTTTKLAKLVGTQQSRISEIENGKGHIYADDLPKYASALNTTVSYLVTGYDPENESLKGFGFSNKAVNILRKKQETCIPNILSQIIEHRLFVPLMKNIESLSKPQKEFNQLFTSAVLLHLTSDLPYVDSPENIRSVYRYITVKMFESIMDSILKGEGNEDETGKR